MPLLQGMGETLEEPGDERSDGCDPAQGKTAELRWSFN